jgi:hypothetical protein
LGRRARMASTDKAPPPCRAMRQQPTCNCNVLHQRLLVGECARVNRKGERVVAHPGGGQRKQRQHDADDRGAVAGNQQRGHGDLEDAGAQRHDRRQRKAEPFEVGRCAAEVHHRVPAAGQEHRGDHDSRDQEALIPSWFPPHLTARFRIAGIPGPAQMQTPGQTRALRDQELDVV